MIEAEIFEEVNEITKKYSNCNDVVNILYISSWTIIHVYVLREIRPFSTGFIQDMEFLELAEP